MKSNGARSDVGIDSIDTRRIEVKLTKRRERDQYSDEREREEDMILLQ